MAKVKSALSNAQRAKMQQSIARKARQPTKGRPRIDGERYACGKLKPPAPNAKVVELRRAMLGNPTASGYKLAAAENPVDLAVARKWLTEADREAINAYRGLYEAAGPAWSAALLKIKVADLNRAGGGGPAVDTPARIARHAASGHLGARDDLRMIWGMLRPYPARQEALNAIALRGEWPAWVITALKLETAERMSDRPVLFGLDLWLRIAAQLIVSRGRADLTKALAVVQSVLGMCRTGRPHPFGEPVAA